MKDRLRAPRRTHTFGQDPSLERAVENAEEQTRAQGALHKKALIPYGPQGVEVRAVALFIQRPAFLFDGISVLAPAIGEVVIPSQRNRNTVSGEWVAETKIFQP